MKYWETDIHNIVSGDFFAMMIATSAICVCYCYCYAHLLPSPIPDAVV